MCVGWWRGPRQKPITMNQGLEAISAMAIMMRFRPDRIGLREMAEWAAGDELGSCPCRVDRSCRPALQRPPAHRQANERDAAGQHQAPDRKQEFTPKNHPRLIPGRGTMIVRRIARGPRRRHRMKGARESRWGPGGENRSRLAPHFCGRIDRSNNSKASCSSVVVTALSRINLPHYLAQSFSIQPPPAASHK